MCVDIPWSTVVALGIFCATVASCVWALIWGVTR
jgi:hypothetical protein